MVLLMAAMVPDDLPYTPSSICGQRSVIAEPAENDDVE